MEDLDLFLFVSGPSLSSDHMGFPVSTASVFCATYILFESCLFMVLYAALLCMAGREGGLVSK